ncbi:MAG: sulfatase-like hydrolase/transferase [Thermoanaerobaculia bacterium]
MTPSYRAVRPGKAAATVALCLAAALVTAGCGVGAPKAATRQPNVLLVTIDTLRADHVGAYGAATGATPNIDRLATEGTRFESAISSVPLTLPSHATILTGLLPTQHGVRNNGSGALAPERTTLAEAFTSRGYATAAFVGAFVLDRRYGLDQGFSVYDDEIDRDETMAGALEAERDGAAVTDRALAWIGNTNGPFFAWVHLYDPHAPYVPPEPFRSRFADRPYDGEIAAADAQLGRLLAMLDAKGLRKDTIVVVTGDHGEALGEHGELTHGLLLFEPTLRVPLVVSAPLSKPGGVVREPVSLADLAPTIAALASVPFGGGKLAGRDISGAVREGVEPEPATIYSETKYPEMFGWSALAAIRSGGAKLIASTGRHMFDLTTDPGETRDVVDQHRRAYHDLDTKLAALRSAETTAAPVPVDSEAMAKLASLGYVGGSPAPPSGTRPDPMVVAPLFMRFEKATWASNDGKLDEAIAQFESLVGEDPANPVFRGSLAKALRDTGNYDRAIHFYQEAVALNPADAEAWYNLAVTLGEAGRKRQSAEAMAEAIRRGGRQPEAHNTLGIVLASEGKTDDAIREFERAVELDPRHARALNNLGNVLRDVGRGDEAERAYQRAIEADGDYADPLNGIGVLEVQRKRPAEAIGYFDRAIRLAPANVEVRLNRAIAYELAGNLKAAAGEYEEFLRIADGRREYAAQRRIAEQLLARLRSGGSRS